MCAGARECVCVCVRVCVRVFAWRVSVGNARSPTGSVEQTNKDQCRVKTTKESQDDKRVSKRIALPEKYTYPPASVLRESNCLMFNILNKVSLQCQP